YRVGLVHGRLRPVKLQERIDGNRLSKTEELALPRAGADLHAQGLHAICARLGVGCRSARCAAASFRLREGSAGAADDGGGAREPWLLVAAARHRRQLESGAAWRAGLDSASS